jgi:hypothetical protein
LVAHLLCFLVVYRGSLPVLDSETSHNKISACCRGGADTHRSVCGQRRRGCCAWREVCVRCNQRGGGGWSRGHRRGTNESGEQLSILAPVMNDATVTRDSSRSSSFRISLTSAIRRLHPFPMPPKEKAANAGVTTDTQQSVASDGIYSYELPRSLVAKIARASVRGSDPLSISDYEHAQVPDNCKFQKETVLALLKGSTVFINCLGTYAFARSHGTFSTRRPPSCWVCLTAATGFHLSKLDSVLTK